MTRSLPLEGIRIVDLSMFMSGPLVTLIAADLGADVIKVESVQRLDGWRGAAAAVEGAPIQPWEMAPSFNWINRNKRGITLNLNDARGAELLKRLVAVSDAVVENYTPRVMANFGLDFEALRAVRPDLVMLSMPGFGMTGSWRDYTAFAWSTEQMAGISHLTGYEDGPPMFTGTTGGDPLAGLVGAVALFAALNHRRRTGEGQYVDLSQLEAATVFMGDALAAAQLTGKDPGRRGNRNPAMAPHNIYPCRDGGWVAICCRDDADWKALAGQLGRPGLAERGVQWSQRDGRMAALAEIDALIGEWTCMRDRFELMHQLQAAGVPAAAVFNGKDLLEDPHLAARGLYLVQDRPGLGPRHYPGQPFRLSGLPAFEQRRAPLLGEHTAEVLATILGIGRQELEALETADVVGRIPLGAR
jgi:crotonobetainyl-CoA:carnitine CoA-transferase CaiB-like acyl-CoA transferase